MKNIKIAPRSDFFFYILSGTSIPKSPEAFETTSATF